MRALKLIRGRNSSIAPIMFAQKSEVTDVAHAKASKSDLVWQPRPEWLRKPVARRKAWN